MIPKNMYEANALRKLTTLDAVDAEIARCNKGHVSAVNNPDIGQHKANEWLRKLAFLENLREEIRRQTLCDNSLNGQQR